MTIDLRYVFAALAALGLPVVVLLYVLCIGLALGYEFEAARESAVAAAFVVGLPVALVAIMATLIDVKPIPFVLRIPRKGDSE